MIHLPPADECRGFSHNRAEGGQGRDDDMDVGFYITGPEGAQIPGQTDPNAENGGALSAIVGAGRAFSGLFGRRAPDSGAPPQSGPQAPPQSGPQAPPQSGPQEGSQSRSSQQRSSTSGQTGAQSQGPQTGASPSGENEESIPRWASELMDAVGAIQRLMRANPNVQPSAGRTRARRPAPTVKLAKPPVPRGDVHNKEAALIRALLVQHWLDGDMNNPARAPTDDAVQRYSEDRRNRPRGWLAHAPAVSDNLVRFSRTNSHWNRGMAVWFMRHVVLPQFNTEIPLSTGPRKDDDISQRIYIKELVTRITACVKNIFVAKDMIADGSREQRNAKSRTQMARKRLLDFRIAKAINTPWLSHTEEALRILDVEGMSSDEEYGRRNAIHAIHDHPYRSAAATNMLREIDAAIFEDDNAISTGSGPKRILRTYTPLRAQSQRELRTPFNAKPFMPEDFYDWDKIGRRADFTMRRLNPKDILLPSPARPEILHVERPAERGPRPELPSVTGSYSVARCKPLLESMSLQVEGVRKINSVKAKKRRPDKGKSDIGRINPETSITAEPNAEGNLPTYHDELEHEFRLWTCLSLPGRQLDPLRHWTSTETPSGICEEFDAVDALAGQAFEFRKRQKRFNDLKVQFSQRRRPRQLCRGYGLTIRMLESRAAWCRLAGVWIWEVRFSTPRNLGSRGTRIFFSLYWNTLEPRPSRFINAHVETSAGWETNFSTSTVRPRRPGFLPQEQVTFHQIRAQRVLTKSRKRLSCSASSAAETAFYANIIGVGTLRKFSEERWKSHVSPGFVGDQTRHSRHCFRRTPVHQLHPRRRNTLKSMGLTLTTTIPSHAASSSISSMQSVSLEHSDAFTGALGCDEECQPHTEAHELLSANPPNAGKATPPKLPERKSTTSTAAVKLASSSTGRELPPPPPPMLTTVSTPSPAPSISSFTPYSSYASSVSSSKPSSVPTSSASKPAAEPPPSVIKVKPSHECPAISFGSYYVGRL
ncbi:hypothetical protein BDZ89DRAFT_1048194 [Hymenopellis radicata]|nr:hypothetical protein BDZ89DRAFT_1048194 [Hymenopellis radicata]